MSNLHLFLNVIITINLICIFFFVANTYKYTVHAVKDIESYPMHESPQVIELLERYKSLVVFMH